MEGFLSVKALMELLGVSRSTVYRLMDRGLPYVKVGSLTRFSKDQVLAWLEAGETDEGEQRILAPGDYRCRQCGWVGHVGEPWPLRQLTCPECQTKGNAEAVR